MSDQQLYELAAPVGQTLKCHGFKLATAESCTGGWIAQCITDVPGSSAWFDRGFITYSNEAKIELLGVDRQTITDFGAVSAETVQAMAMGTLRHSLANIVVAVSGIAGPSGGTQQKPVGTVWFAWQRLGGECLVKQYWFEGERRTIRWHAVKAALQGILDVCRS
jgi:nicotinamide-nucleotide amidase